MLGRDEAWLVSDWAASEFASVVARDTRVGTLIQQQARSAFDHFDAWLTADARLVLVTPADMAFVQRLIRRLDINTRAPDALHLAVAARLGASFATFDDGQAAAAVAIGLRVEAT